MIIVHDLDHHFFSLFPDIPTNDLEAIRRVLTEYYSFGPYRPRVEVRETSVLVRIDTDAIERGEKAYRKAVSYAEKGRYSEAKRTLDVSTWRSRT